MTTMNVFRDHPVCAPFTWCWHFEDGRPLAGLRSGVGIWEGLWMAFVNKLDDYGIDPDGRWLSLEDARHVVLTHLREVYPDEVIPTGRDLGPAYPGTKKKSPLDVGLRTKLAALSAARRRSVHESVLDWLQNHEGLETCFGTFIAKGQFSGFLPAVLEKGLPSSLVHLNQGELRDAITHVLRENGVRAEPDGESNGALEFFWEDPE